MGGAEITPLETLIAIGNGIGRELPDILHSSY